MRTNRPQIKSSMKNSTLKDKVLTIHRRHNVGSRKEITNLIRIL